MDNFGDRVDKGQSKQIIGDLGEDIASKFLKKQGFFVLDRNYRKKFGEIDIVARKGETVHFVEVKTVSRGTLPIPNGDDYLPEENIHPWKIKRLSRAVQAYLLEKRVGEDLEWQIDSVAIYLEKRTNKVLKIEMLEDILV